MLENWRREIGPKGACMNLQGLDWRWWCALRGDIRSLRHSADQRAAAPQQVYW